MARPACCSFYPPVFRPTLRLCVWSIRACVCVLISQSFNHAFSQARAALPRPSAPFSNPFSLWVCVKIWHAFNQRQHKWVRPPPLHLFLLCLFFLLSVCVQERGSWHFPCLMEGLGRAAAAAAPAETAAFRATRVLNICIHHTPRAPLNSNHTLTPTQLYPPPLYQVELSAPMLPFTLAASPQSSYLFVQHSRVMSSLFFWLSKHKF